MMKGGKRDQSESFTPQLSRFTIFYLFRIPHSEFRIEDCPWWKNRRLVAFDKKELVGAVAELLASGYRPRQNRLHDPCRRLRDELFLATGITGSRTPRFTGSCAREVQEAFICIYWKCLFSTRTEIPRTSSASPLRKYPRSIYRGTLYRTRIPSPFGLSEKPAGREDSG